MIAAKTFEPFRETLMAARSSLISVAAICALMPIPPATAAPLPPPPPGAIERATAIVSFPREGDLADYVKLFADDVVVVEGDTKVASNRAEFLAYLRARPSMNVRPLRVSYGNPILVVESVNNYPDHWEQATVRDCCSWARVASYHLDPGGLVDRVLFLGNGTYWGRPEHPDQ